MLKQDCAEVHAIMHGYVQGVGYRFETQQQARNSGVTGTVRNLPDGSVEIRAQGDKAVLETFLATMKKYPHEGAVRAADITWKEARKPFKEFSVVF
jgi:acylphosphatase